MRLPAALLILMLTPLLFAAEPELRQLDLFKAGDAGYAIYRIPSLIVTSKGTLLACCEARKTASDWGQIDILLRRSTDSGQTWSAPIPVALIPADAKRNAVAPKSAPSSDRAITLSNPVLISDRDGVVHLLYCVEYSRCFYRRSTDDGVTFSAPAEITSTFESFRTDFDWKVLATGPGHGIQLRTGRLLVPIWLSLGTGKSGHGDSRPATIYSDDHGTTWNSGEIISDPKLINGNETAAVELSDGRVMLNIRHPGEPHFRAVTTSPTGIDHWSAIRFDEQLPEPVCMGSLLRLDDHHILFCNPHNPDSRDRKNLTIKLSEDDGVTWATARTLHPGPSAYSDLAASPDGTIFCLYERGDNKPNERLTLARFTLSWLRE